MAKEIDMRIFNIEATIKLQGVLSAQSLQDLLDRKISGIRIDDGDIEIEKLVIRA